MHLDKKDRYYVRYGKRFCTVKVKTKYEENDLHNIYSVYQQAAQRIGYIPRDVAIFKSLNASMLCSIAYNNNDLSIEGFAIGYLSSTPLYKKVMHVIFAGTTNTGRNHKIGYSLYFDLLTKAFEEYKVDIVDMIGASRTQNRTYTLFKDKFGGDFKSLPGSFKKIIIL